MNNYIHIHIIYTSYVSDVPIIFEYVCARRIPHTHEGTLNKQVSVNCEMFSQKCLKIRKGYYYEQLS